MTLLIRKIPLPGLGLLALGYLAYRAVIALVPLLGLPMVGLP